MRRILAGTALAVLAALGVAGPASGASRLDFGIQDPLSFEEPDPGGAFDAVRNQGMRIVRIPLTWSSVAPTKPRNPEDPNDPAYNWGPIDTSVDASTNRGLDPELVPYSSPMWARPKSKAITSSPANFAKFVKAAARRYRGRVKYWEMWNEPNLRIAFQDTPAHYRAMSNAAYTAIHGVSSSNVVVAGALAPFSGPTASSGMRPMTFMRKVLCMSGGSHPRPTCSARSLFDVWSHHPYTNGGPNHKANAAGDVSLGNLPEMRRLLRAAQNAGHIKSKGGPARFWVTEFSWDTNPPDPGGISPTLEARWAAEAFYRMWQSDVSLIVWFQIRDNVADPSNWGSTFQGGLFFRTTDSYASEREKPVALVVRFPFVALPEGRGIAIWGRTPGGHRAKVAVERQSGKSWKRVKTIRSNGNGIFRGRLAGGTGALFRARVGGATSTAFKAIRTRDRPAFAFGGPRQP
jgi:hypothetical protein